MSKKVELTPQEAKLICQALFELGIEAKFCAADRINTRIAKLFAPKSTTWEKWLCALRLS